MIFCIFLMFTYILFLILLWLSFIRLDIASYDSFEIKENIRLCTRFKILNWWLNFMIVKIINFGKKLWINLKNFWKYFSPSGIISSYASFKNWNFSKFHNHAFIATYDQGSSISQQFTFFPNYRRYLEKLEKKNLESDWKYSENIFYKP